MTTLITPSFLAEHPLPTHADASDKHQRGRVLVVAGSVEIAGAALLAGMGALRAGAGRLQIATCRSAAVPMSIAMPEALVFGCEETSKGGIRPDAVDRLSEMASNSDAVLIGPGMVDTDATIQLTRDLLANSSTKFVLDAEAFVQMAGHIEDLKNAGERIVVTPHPGEMAKFLGAPREDIERDPELYASKARDKTAATVVLKGVTTYIAAPSGETYVCDHGCIGLATSGSGDTLAGIMVGLVARGAPLHLAACWATYLHAEAGQRLTRSLGPVGFLAREIVDHIPGAMADLSPSSGCR